MSKKKSKKLDDYWENEFEKDIIVDSENPSAPISVNDDDGEGLMAIMKKSHKNSKKEKIQSNPEEQAPKEEQDPKDDENPSRIKSKKEKEKERKERQKQAKKESSSSSSVKVSSVAAPAASKTPAPSASIPPAAPTKKKGGPPVSALREMLALKQAAEQEQQRLLEQEQEAERLRLLNLEQEQKLKEQARQKKKEREMARKELLRKEGKLMSESEKKKLQMAQAKLKVMREQGLIVPDLKSDENVVKVKKVVYDDRKKNKNKSSQQQQQQQQANVDAHTVEKEVPDSWEEVADSWEDIDEAPPVECSNVETRQEQQSDSEHDQDSENDDANVAPVSKSSSAVTAAAPVDRSAPVVDTSAPSDSNLRSPICVILGHVDTGKTKLLDKIRQTNVQEGEAGGITQQIGATYFPTESIKLKTEVIRQSPLYSSISAKTGFSQLFEFKVPGLLVIDTPGHESFTNLRSRGSSLCNIAILVIDIMHGLEPQTIESINLLKKGKTPFIVALNKIDRIYGWSSTPDNSFLDSFELQSAAVKKEFNERSDAAKLALAEQGLNSELYFKNLDVRKYVSIVPTSAITGEGVPDLLMLLMQLTQNRLSEKLTYLSALEATVLEVKIIEGLGTTIDVVLSNGILREGDRIVVCGLNGPIVTNIRALLTPQPMKELRVKSAYVHHKEIKAAMGVKISAPDLEKAIAGSRLLVVKPGDDEEELMEEVMTDLTDLFESVDKSGKGVCVQASTLGSLEALLSFLKDSKIPVAGINIGPIYKKDIMRASIMLEHAREYATILAFDVKVDREMQEMADHLGVRIFKADIIYHLFDQFTAYMKNLTEAKRKEMAPSAVWPCLLKIVPGCVFNKTDPIIVGVDVVDGSLRIGTPICVPGRGAVVLGKVVGIEANHKPVEVAKKGQQVAVRIENGDAARVFGRHFLEGDELCSRITRESIDVLKASFRDEVTKDEWLLVKRLKTVLKID